MKLRALSIALVAVGFMTAAGAQIRPEVGKPLQQAGELLKAGKAREALAKVREADAVSGKNAQEQLTIERMRGAAAQRAGDNATAIQAFETIYPKLSGSEQMQVAESLAFAYSQQRNWSKSGEWADRAEKLGSNSSQLKQLQQYLQAQSGDYSGIAKDAAAQVAAAEKAGKRPAEDDLLRLADAANRMNNHAQYSAALEKLVVYYGKKDYWNAHLARIQRKPGFSSRLSLDVLRLKFANGLLSSADEFMEMAQLSLQAGLAAEGKRIVDQGFKTGVLGTGPQSDRHQRLRALADKQAAEEKQNIAAAEAAAEAAKYGNDLVQVGYNYVMMGQAEKGAQLIEKGIAKGGLKRPDEAKLRHGLALVEAGKKSRGVQVLRSVQGNDGTADIARLWASHANQG